MTTTRYLALAGVLALTWPSALMADNAVEVRAECEFVEGTAPNGALADKLARQLHSQAVKKYPSVSHVKFDVVEARRIPGLSISGEVNSTVTCSGRAYDVHADTKGVLFAWTSTWGELARLLARRTLMAAPCGE